MLEREKTMKRRLKGGAEIEITYKVPTALDTESFIKKDTLNSAIVKKFVTEVICTDDTINNADDLLNAPGGFGLCSDVALAIVSESILDDNEKN